MKVTKRIIAVWLIIIYSIAQLLMAIWFWVGVEMAIKYQAEPVLDKSVVLWSLEEVINLFVDMSKHSSLYAIFISFINIILILYLVTANKSTISS